MRVPRFLSKLIPNYELIDIKEWLSKGLIELYFRKIDPKASMSCSVCGESLKRYMFDPTMNASGPISYQN
jgi:hypothetical protein